MDNEAFVVDNEDVPGLFPANFKHELAKFNDLIAWKTVQNGAKSDQIPEPRTGIDANFDEKNGAVNAIKDDLNRILLSVRRRFDNDRRVQFSHAKYRYELEIPAEHVKGNKKPVEFEFTSQRQGLLAIPYTGHQEPR
jgi:DNA mismatch repair protein MSH6